MLKQDYLNILVPLGDLLLLPDLSLTARVKIIKARDAIAIIA